MTTEQQHAEGQIELLVKQIDVLRAAEFDDEEDRKASIDAVEVKILRLKTITGPRRIEGAYGGSAEQRAEAHSKPLRKE